MKELPISASKCFCHPSPAGLKKIAEGSSATAAKARPMPIARAPCVLIWNPEGKAGAAERRMTAARKTETRRKRTRRGLVTLTLLLKAKVHKLLGEKNLCLPASRSQRPIESGRDPRQ